eukprot:CAMPEP_0181238220 /NCGR_PEP_ID=MMETSP1096-20121128/39218_1 /TAXON_ID=156174 ORGANISM="Chrysochromulina ericina, Strain CCMP281" /NCGR_SAMPLE_ID=MMETSP1096 /ASSEMBLY_ACC=CAM_ASM_000453 /LENGTH=155 /DNA_ID=CAMNT_0023333703 /DNA_START=633 /DNA_END=1100 /DNA_ORIENTATION=+
MRKDGVESAILSTILLRRSHEPPAVAQQFCLPQLGRETVERRCAEGGEDGPDKPNAVWRGVEEQQVGREVDDYPAELVDNSVERAIERAARLDHALRRLREADVCPTVNDAASTLEEVENDQPALFAHHRIWIESKLWVGHVVVVAAHHTGDAMA